MRDKRKSRWLQSCRIGLERTGAGAIDSLSPVLAAAWPTPATTTARLADQARHRHHRREPQLRSRVRHLRAEAAPERASQPALQGHHQARRQQERAPGPQLREGAAAGGAGYRRDGCVPAEPAEADIPQRPAAGPAGRRPEGLLHPQRVRQHADHQCDGSLTLAKQSETGLAARLLSVPHDRRHRPDLEDARPRITNVNALPAGPFQLTNGNAFAYNAYAASPVHRFYQMWQQLNCSTSRTPRRDNPSGCNGNLFSWVEVTVGAGANGAAQPANFSTEYSPTQRPRGEGSTALGFYNVQKGDVPYFTSLARQVRDERQLPPVRQRRHRRQPHHARPRRRDLVQRRQRQAGGAAERRSRCSPARPTPASSTRSKIPNPAAGTNNWYTQDGYGNGGNAGFRRLLGSPVSGGGSYSDCSDPTQPGVRPILDYLQSLPRPINPRCEPGHYYLLNNYNPGYFGNGKNAYIDTNPANTPFTIPPSSTPQHRRQPERPATSRGSTTATSGTTTSTIPYQLNYGTPGPTADEYCNICNPFQYDTSIMSNPDQVAAHIQDTANLYADIAERHAARGLVRQAERLRRRPPGVVQARSVRRLHQEDRRRRSRPSDLREGHRHLHHLRRRRRLLRLGLRAAARLLRRRHPHPADRGVAVREARPHLARLRRPRLDPQVHRAQLGSAADHAAQPRQLPEPDRRAPQIPTCR